MELDWDHRLLTRLVHQLIPTTEGSDNGRSLPWFEVTVSSFSASEFVAQPPQQPDTTTPTTDYWMSTKYRAPTDGTNVAIQARPDTTLYIEERLLVDTTDDMMRWIIVMNEDPSNLEQAHTNHPRRGATPISAYMHGLFLPLMGSSRARSVDGWLVCQYSIRQLTSEGSRTRIGPPRPVSIARCGRTSSEPR